MAKIVVIEDELAVCNNLALLLKLEGHEVSSAPDGEAGLALVRNMLPDLVLCDVNMPKMDGHQVLGALQNDPATLGIPFVFLTAKVEKGDFRQGMSGGASDYLTKPFARDDVLQAVAVQLRKRQAQHDAQRKAHAAATVELEIASASMRREIDHAQTLLAHFLDLRMATDGRLRYLSRPKEIASGDMLLTRQRPDGGIVVLLGDATGHGLTAAVATLPAVGVFEATVVAGMPLPEVLSAVNSSLRVHLGGGMFIAAAMIEFDAKSGVLSAWNGGMPSILLFDAEGVAMGEVVSSNVALGLIDDDGWTFSHYQCAPGSRAYLYSDGLSECADPQGREYGVERLREAITRHFRSEDRLERINAEIAEHCAGAVPHDDMTLAEVVLR